MKCPKCDYLGFDTGDRCRNCGYDFSLMAQAPESPPLVRTPSPAPPASPRRTPPAMPDLDLRRPEREAASQTPPWDDQIDRGLGGQPSPPIEHPQPPPAFRGEPSLPLFGGAGDDEPLIKLPATPRPPLAVRRTPDTRLRTAARQSREVEPTLLFRDDASASPPTGTPARAATADAVSAGTPQHASGIGQRLLAAAIDHAILLAIDLAVVYFTLRLALLSWADWSQVPALPMLTFLALIQLAYFTAFTAFGGQTIGKMAAGIRVVADDNRLVDPACAVRRALAGVLSLLTLGAGFLPALFASDRRALHDRLARTRVVALRTA